MSKSAKVQKRGSREAKAVRDGAAYSNKIITVFYTVLITYVALMITGCTKQEQMYKESRILMDTYCTITVISPSREKARSAIDAGFEEISKLGLLLNYFSDTSEITAVNRAAGIRPVRVSDETMEIMKVGYPS